MNSIKTKVLRIAFDKIIEKLVFEEVEEVELPYDLYQFIPTGNWRIDNNNLEIITGSLTDDIENIQKLMDDPNRPCTYVDFDRVASLLRIISEVRNPVEDETNDV